MKFKLYFFLSLFLLLIPTALFAGEFQTIVGIPGVTENINGTTGLNDYINALYRLSISIAALLAVIKIVAAGAKYMLTDIVPAKEEAKKDIQGALVGLLIVIAAVIILNTVNSDLTRVNFNLEPLVAPTSTAPVVPVTPVDALCNTGGGCTLLTCDAVGLSLGSYVLQGAIAGGLTGATGLAVLGPLGTLTTAGGVVLGSVVGGVFYLAEDYASCPAVCAWSYGTMINTNTCSVPNDKVAYMNAEAAASAAREAARIAELNRQISECSSQTEMRWDALTATCVSIFNVPPII